MVTVSEVKEMLSTYGLSAPDILIERIIAKVSSIQGCMSIAGYDDDTQWLISVYACCLMVANQGSSRIQSQTAPSGASRSFAVDKEVSTKLFSLLTRLDTAGCTGSLPLDPDINNIGLFLVVGNE